MEASVAAVAGLALVLATEVIPGDQISVILTGEDGSGKRTGFSYTFNSEGEQINPVSGTVLGGRKLELAGSDSDGEEPEFDVAAYKEALQVDGFAAAADLSRDYQDDFVAWQGKGGSLTVDAIRDSILAFMKAEHDVREEDHTGYVIKDDQVQVRTPPRQNDRPGRGVVQMAPAWG